MNGQAAPNAFYIPAFSFSISKTFSVLEWQIKIPANSTHSSAALGSLRAVSVIIGNVIGTGVFLKARVMTCNLGSPGWVIAAWVVAGFLSLAGALTYAELTAMRPMAGNAKSF